MIRYVLKSMNTLNLLLAAALLLMAGYALLPLSRDRGTVRVSAPQVKPAAKQAEDLQAPEEQSIAAVDYIVISDRNLFHPERIIPVEKKEEEKPLPKPDFVLYGTLIDGETKLAFMDDLKAPYTTPGRGKRQRVIAQGGNLSGYVLREVHEDRVVMVRGEEKIPVILDDTLHKRTAPAQTTAQPPAAAEKLQPAPGAQAQRPPAASSGAPAAQTPAQTYLQKQREALRRNPRSIRR